MGRIFYIMGKSATGKDTVFKELLKRRPEPLRRWFPIPPVPSGRERQTGVEYFFTSSEKLEQFKNSGKIVELRTYETVMGPWSYFTMDDGQFDIHGEGDCLMIGTLESYEKMCRYYGNGALVPVYIEVPDGIRLLRAVKREGKQKNPNYREVCRRYLADEDDFSEELLSRLRIGKRFSNTDLEACLEEILKEMESH